MRMREMQFNFAYLRLSSVCLALLLAVLIPAAAWAATPKTVKAAKAAGDEAQWTIMVYSDGDDPNIEADLVADMQEMELAGSTDKVNIVIQSDRYKGGYAGLGDWTTTKRFYVTKDDDMNSVSSQEIEDLGEVNMADGGALKDFVEWAVTNYPAQKTMLIISDHGGGWPGSSSDPDPGGDGPDKIDIAKDFGDMLWLMETDKALTEAQQDVGLDHFDVIGFDACLMSQLEVYSALAPHALYAVASEEEVPYLGYAYAAFLKDLDDHPEWDGAQLSKDIVKTYIDQDARLDDPNYADDNPGETAQQAAESVGKDTTMTAVDLSKIADVNIALDTFVGGLETLDPNVVDHARANAQSYISVFGDDDPSPYIDLGSFSQIIQANADEPDVINAGADLDSAIADAVIDERHGPDRPGSTGIAIYFPVPALYDQSDDLDYTTVAQRFTDETQWDEFLAYANGNGDESFTRPASALNDKLKELLPDWDQADIDNLESAIDDAIANGTAQDDIVQSLISDYDVPEETANQMADDGLLAPPTEAAAGSQAENNPSQAAIISPNKPIHISPVTLSAHIARPGEPVTVSADIEGDRVGFVYSFIGRYLPDKDVLIVEDQDYIFADDQTTTGGITYPKWPQGAFTASFDWEPTVYSISDGKTSIRTLFAPDTYGDDPTYSVQGIYHFADGRPDLSATVYFQDNEATQVIAYTNNSGSAELASSSGTPKEIRPAKGDTFTVLSQGFNLAEDAKDENYQEPIGDLTFGDKPFTLEETPAPSGNYLVGIIAEDLDGNTYEQYQPLFVENDQADNEAGLAAYTNEDIPLALLHPETWAVDDSAANQGVVTFADADNTVQTTMELLSYPDAEDAAAATKQGLTDALKDYADSYSLEKMKIGDSVDDYLLGGYEGLSVEFTYELNGEQYKGEAAAATPIDGSTYVAIFDSVADQYDKSEPLFEELAYSFDSLEDVNNVAIGAPQPDFDQVSFTDDYTDASSGLYDQQQEEWGASYYDTKAQNYVYELEPNPGAIYDYYDDVTLEDNFMVQTSAQYKGSQDTAYGLIFNVQDDEHYYAFRVSGDAYFTVEKIDGDKSDTLVDLSSADPMGTQEGTPNTLAVVGNGGDYQLYVNGEEVGSFSDSSYSGGTAGYMVDNFDTKNGATFTFDDFMVGTPAQ